MGHVFLPLTYLAGLRSPVCILLPLEQMTLAPLCIGQSFVHLTWLTKLSLLPLCTSNAVAAND